MGFITAQVVQPYNTTDTIIALKNSRFTLSERSDFSMVNNLSIAAYVYF